jgi:hypothetical protein
MHSRNFITPQIKIWEDTETTKWTQRGLQQTQKWNKRDYKRTDTWNKEDNKRYERGVEQRYGKLQKEESNRNPGNKKSL